MFPYSYLDNVQLIEKMKYSDQQFTDLELELLSRLEDLEHDYDLLFYSECNELTVSKY